MPRSRSQNIQKLPGTEAVKLELVITERVEKLAFAVGQFIFLPIFDICLSVKAGIAEAEMVHPLTIACFIKDYNQLIDK